MLPQVGSPPVGGEQLLITTRSKTSSWVDLEEGKAVSRRSNHKCLRSKGKDPGILKMTLGRLNRQLS
jgi:hypothetical protein